MFVYLSKLLFSRFLQCTCKGNFLRGRINSKYRDWAPLSVHVTQRPLAAKITSYAYILMDCHAMNLRDDMNNRYKGDYLVFWLLLPCCKICFNFCFQSARVSSAWSIRHSEKSFATSSGKTEETRFQGSTNRVETSFQLTKDSGYVQCHSRSVFSTFPPIPISSSTRLPFPHLSSPIPHPLFPRSTFPIPISP